MGLAKRGGERTMKLALQQGLVIFLSFMAYPALNNLATSSRSNVDKLQVRAQNTGDCLGTGIEYVEMLNAPLLNNDGRLYDVEHPIDLQVFRNFLASLSRGYMTSGVPWAQEFTNRFFTNFLTSPNATPNLSSRYSSTCYPRPFDAIAEVLGSNAHPDNLIICERWINIKKGQLLRVSPDTGLPMISPMNVALTNRAVRLAQKQDSGARAAINALLSRAQVVSNVCPSTLGATLMILD